MSKFSSNEKAVESMKIIIKEKGKGAIRLWFPNALIFSNVAAKIATRQLKKKVSENDGEGITSIEIECERKEDKTFSYKSFVGNIPEDKIKDAMRIFRNMRKDFPGIPLIEVHAADGTRVLVKM